MGLRVRLDNYTPKPVESHNSLGGLIRDTRTSD